MTKEAKKYTVHILKEQYVLVSDEPEEIVLQTVELLSSYVSTVEQHVSVSDNKKLIVLAALQLASDLLHMQQALMHDHTRYKELVALIEKTVSSLDASTI